MDNTNNSDNFGGIPADSLINELNELGAGKELGTGPGCDCGRPNCVTPAAHRVSEALAGAGSFEGACSVFRSFSVDDRRLYLACSLMALVRLSTGGLAFESGSCECDRDGVAAVLMAAELLSGESMIPPSERMEVAAGVLKSFVDLPTAGGC